MSTAKLSYDYLIQNPQAQRIIKTFNKGIYGKVLDSPEENTAKFLEHHRKYDMLNEITVFQDLSYVRDTEERNGLKQNERLINYRQARDLFDNYEGGFGAGGESALNTLGDYAEGFAMSPSLWLGLATGGVGKTAQVAATRLSAQAVKQFVKDRTKKLGLKRGPLDKTIRKFAQTQALTTPVRIGGLGAPIRTMTAKQAAGKYGLKQAGIAAGIEGTAGLLTDSARQGIELEGKETGLNVRDEFSPTQAIAMGGLSSAVTGGIAYPLAKWQAGRAAKIGAIVGGERTIVGRRVQKAKRRIDADENARAVYQQMKEQLQKENDDLWKNIDEKGKELLDEKFEGGLTDLTRSQVRTEINDNMAYAFTEIFESGKIKFLPTEGEGSESITRQIFKHLDPNVSTPVEIANIKGTLQKYGLSIDDFRFMWWSTISDAGKTLGIWGNFVKNMKPGNKAEFDKILRGSVDSFESAAGYTGSLRKAEQEAILLERSAARGNVGDYIKTADNFRRAMMVMQPKTAVRNFISVVGRLPLDAGARLVDNSMTMIANTIEGRPFSQGVRWSDSAAILKNVVDNGRAGAQIEEILTNVDKYHYHNLFTNYSEISHALGANSTSFTKGTQWVSDRLNILNRTQEHLFRRAVFMGSIERQLSKRGIIGEKGLYKNMKEFTEGSADGKLGSGLSNKALWTDKDNMIERAIEDALEFTFQANVGARGSATYARGPIIRGYDNIMKPLVKLLSSPYGGTAIIPFPRFLYNAMKFQIEHSPLGYLDALMSQAGKRSMKKAVDKAEPLTPKDFSRIGKATIGSMMWGAAYMFRKSSAAGEKFDEVIDERGNSVNIGAVGPNVVPYLFWADYYIRNWEEAERPVTYKEIQRQLEAGVPLKDIEKTVAMRAGPRAYKDGKAFWRDAARAGIGTQARIGQFSSFIDDLFVNTNKTRIEKDFDSGSVFLNLVKAFDPVWSVAGNYLSGFVTPFGMLQDAYSIYDGDDEISRTTQFNKISGPVTARLPKPLRLMLSGVGAYEETLPVKDAFGPGFIRKQAPVLQQMTGLLIKRPKTIEHKEFDRLGFQYQDLIKWDESPSLTYAYKLRVDQTLKALRPYIESPQYQRKTDAERGAWWNQIGILLVRNNAREGLKTMFADKFSDENFYDSLNLLRAYTHEELTELDSKGILDELIAQRGLDQERLEEEMKKTLFRKYKKYLR